VGPGGYYQIMAPRQTSKTVGIRSGRPVMLSGLLFFLAGVVGFMGIITAEALYPSAYSTGNNTISDLGATVPPDSVICQPSAAIFNSVMIVTGLMTLGGSLLLYRGTRRRPAPIIIALFGIGIMGVGIFPGSFGLTHVLFALLTFIAGGLAAIVSAFVVSGPFRYVSILLGLVTLATLSMHTFLGSADPMSGLGLGGEERWIAYPTVFWMTGFGGYLMGRSSTRRLH
jgi:hypothetical membrane protein